MAPTQTQTHTYFIVMFMSFFSYTCELNFNVILPVHKRFKILFGQAI